MLDAETLELLEGLPRKAHSLWLGDRRPSEAQLENQGPLDLMIWLDAKSGKIRTGMVAPRSEGTEVMMVSLLQAIMDPAGELKPGLPGRLSVPDEATYRYLEAHVSPLKIDLLPWPGCEFLDQAYADMERTLSRGPGPTYLEKLDNTPELIERLFSTSLDYFEAAPWAGRPDTQPVCLQGLAISPLYVSLLGDEGAEFGLAIYLTTEAAKAVLGSVDPAIMTRHPVLMFSFSHPDDTGPGLLIEASDRGWPMVDAECVPLLVRSDRPDDFVAHGTDVMLAVDVLEAVTLAMPRKKKFKSGPVRLRDGRTVDVEWPVQGR